MKTLQIALGVFLGSLMSSLIIMFALLHSMGSVIDNVIEVESKKYPKHFTIDGVECIAVNMFSLSCNWNKDEGEQ